MNTTVSSINGAIFEEKRIELKLSREDLAKSLCLNANQIKQIETGGQVSFYSFAHKARSAKKVAVFLEIPEEVAFIFKPIEILPLPPAEISLKEVLDVEPELKSTQVVKTKSRLITPALLFSLLLITSISFWIYSENSGNSAVLVKENGNDKALSSIPSAPPEKELQPITPSTQESLATNINACDIPEPTNVTEIQVKNPQYIGDSISVRASKNMDICILDGTSEKRRYELEENTKKIIPVRSKFTILGQDLTNLRLYFQGERIEANPNVKNVLSIKANPTYPSM